WRTSGLTGVVAAWSRYTRRTGIANHRLPFSRLTSARRSNCRVDRSGDFHRSAASAAPAGPVLLPYAPPSRPVTATPTTPPWTDPGREPAHRRSAAKGWVPWVPARPTRTSMPSRRRQPLPLPLPRGKWSNCLPCTNEGCEGVRYTITLAPDRTGWQRTVQVHGDYPPGHLMILVGRYEESVFGPAGVVEDGGLTWWVAWCPACGGGFV